MDFRDQWEKVDMDFLKQFVFLHNQISFGEKDEKEFDDFVLNNKNKLNNPDYLQVFAARVRLNPDYYREHYDMCYFFYDFMQNNPDWEKLDFPFSTYLVLKIFEESFKEHLN